MDAAALQEIKNKLQKAFAVLPVITTMDNRVWYELKPNSGAARTAADQCLEIIREGRIVPDAQQQAINESVGLNKGVVRHDDYYGPSFVYPEIYGAPLQISDSLYMACPKGLDLMTAEPTHFVPEGGRQLTETEAIRLERGLFTAWGGQNPAIYREPRGLKL